MKPDYIVIAPPNATQQQVEESSDGLRRWMSKETTAPLVLPNGWQLQRLGEDGRIVETYGHVSPRDRLEVNGVSWLLGVLVGILLSVFTAVALSFPS